MHRDGVTLETTNVENMPFYQRNVCSVNKRVISIRKERFRYTLFKTVVSLSYC